VENELSALWGVVLGGLGICATGFFFLIVLVLKVPSNVTKPLQEIRDALIGTLEKPGLIPKFHNMEKEIKHIKDNCTAMK